MKVYIIKTPEYGNEEFKQVYKFLSSFEGPIKFVASEFEFDKNDFPFLTFNNTVSEEAVSPIDLMKFCDFGERNANDNRLLWSELYSLCDTYRSSFVDDSKDFVVLLTKWKNEYNCFSLFNENRNIVVHTEDWDKFTSGVNPMYPIAYEIIENIIQTLMDNGFDVDKYFREIRTQVRRRINNPDKPVIIPPIVNEYVHSKSKGCINDFCQNKEDVILKLKSADICPVCSDRLEDSITTKQLDQVSKLIRTIREKFVYDFNIKNSKDKPSKPCSIIVDGKYSISIMTEFGPCEFDFFSKQKALYLFFLQNAKSGIKVRIADLHKHQDELEQLYLKTSPNKKNISDSIALITNHHGDNFNALVSSINRDISGFTKNAGIDQFYKIRRDENGYYSISLTKNLIDFRF